MLIGLCIFKVPQPVMLHCVQFLVYVCSRRVHAAAAFISDTRRCRRSHHWHQASANVCVTPRQLLVLMFLPLSHWRSSVVTRPAGQSQSPDWYQQLSGDLPEWTGPQSCTSPRCFLGIIIALCCATIKMKFVSLFLWLSEEQLNGRIM